MALGFLGVAVEAPDVANAAGDAPAMTWWTVANNGDVPPDASIEFNSYNQPSVNSSGLVVFRARTKADGAEPRRGVYARNPRAESSPIAVVASNGTAVPQPNNLATVFTEFPAFPRIDRVSDTIATRGQSQPVWTYVLPDLTETRIGTSGLYATVNGTLTTAASLLGIAPGYEYFAVPGAAAGTRFGQFPGSPAVDGTVIAFKGNYTDIGTAQERTGVFFRDAAVAEAPVRLVANSQTLIPGQAPGGTVLFGSTSPPSAAAGKMVFLAVDNEDNPTMGGIYLAPMTETPTLEALVAIGDQVPGMAPTDVFTRLGEGLSFDGRFVAFWGAWGADTTPITLQCPSDGNADLRAYCVAQYPAGFATTTPVHQGFFVLDTVTGSVKAVAETDARFDTFQYWVYSGAPPNVGDPEATQELPRWRSSAFAAVSGRSDGTYRAAFKATEAGGGSGIFMAEGPVSQPIVTIVDTSVAGTTVDPDAPSDTVVSSVGLERDGFRGNFIALNVGMVNADESASWAGVYLVGLQTPAVPVAPSRLLETRSGADYTTVDGLLAGVGVLPAGSVTVVPVAGRAGVPVDAAAVELNVTVTGGLAAGFVTVFPCGSPVPSSSNLNYVAGATVANSAIVEIGADGAVCVFTQAATDMVIDVATYLPKGSYEPITPSRLLETRSGAEYTTVDGLLLGAGLLPAGSVTVVPVAGRAGVPVDAAAVELNVTVTGALAAGFVTVFPCGSPVPSSSNLNYVAGATVANSAIVEIGADGAVCVYAHKPTHVLIDVAGWFAAS